MPSRLSICAHTHAAATTASVGRLAASRKSRIYTPWTRAEAPINWTHASARGSSAGGCTRGLTDSAAEPTELLGFVRSFLDQDQASREQAEPALLDARRRTPEPFAATGRCGCTSRPSGWTKKLPSALTRRSPVPLWRCCAGRTPSGEAPPGYAKSNRYPRTNASSTNSTKRPSSTPPRADPDG